jgi:hypothetical protein
MIVISLPEFTGHGRDGSRPRLMRKIAPLLRAPGVREPDISEQAEDLNSSDKSHTMLEIEHSGLAEQG